MANKDPQQIHFHESKFLTQTGHLQHIKIPVVQDLARSRTLPGNFIQNPAPTRSSLPPGATFDAVDVSRLRDPDSRAAELRKMERVCREWSMFRIENHGLDPTVVEELERTVKFFFELPFEEKKRSVGTYMSTDNMGYGRNFVKTEDQPLDWIDRLAMKAAPEGATDGIHVWPQNPPNFRSVMEKYVTATRGLLDELLEALAECVSLPKHAFSQYFNPRTSEINVRVNYYPPCPNPNQAIGLTAHTDASVLSLLVQFESTNGLQYFRDEQWVNVPWPRNTLLVNLGDLVEIMSNGRLKSSWHRAGTQDGVHRYSVALFYNPAADETIGPPTMMEDEDHVKEYTSVVVGDYIKNFYSVSPTVNKETTILFAKVRNS